MKTIKRRTSSSLTPSRYETFLRSVQLVAMGLARSSSRLDRAEYVRLQREAEGGNLKFKTDYRLEEVGPQYFEVRGVFALLVEDPKTADATIPIAANTDGKNAEGFERATTPGQELSKKAIVEGEGRCPNA